MNFVITNIGISRIQDAQAGGFKIVIAEFRLGSEAGFTPAPTDTSVRGTEVYRGKPTGFSIEGDNTVVYNLVLDANVGPFVYGNVGLFLEGGELFALGARDHTLQKLVTTASAVGNVIEEEARVVLSNIQPVIEFTGQGVLVPETSDLSFIPAPAAAAGNAYIAHETDDDGNHMLLYKEANGIWGINTHQNRVIKRGLVTGESNTTLITSTNIPSPELLTNPGFTGPAGWTAGVGWILGTESAFSNGDQAVNADLTQTVGKLVADAYYLVEINVTSLISGTLSVSVGGSTAVSVSSDTRHYLVQAGSTKVFTITANSSFVGRIDSASLVEVEADIVTNGTFASDVELGEERRMDSLLFGRAICSGIQTAAADIYQNVPSLVLRQKVYCSVHHIVVPPDLYRCSSVRVALVLEEIAPPAHTPRL